MWLWFEVASRPFEMVGPNDPTAFPADVAAPHTRKIARETTVPPPIIRLLGWFPCLLQCRNRLLFIFPSE